METTVRHSQCVPVAGTADIHSVQGQHTATPLRNLPDHYIMYRCPQSGICTVQPAGAGNFQSAPHPASSRMDCSPACTGRLWLHIVRCSPGKRELQGTSGYLRFARSAGCFRRIPHSPVVRYPFGKLERQRPCPATGHRLMQCPASGSGGIHR